MVVVVSKGLYAKPSKILINCEELIMITLYKKALNMAMWSILLLSQISLAAIHNPPSGGNLGSLQFGNVLVDVSSNISANLTATDNANIYAGQVYTLNPNLGPPSGAQDAIYSSLTQKIEARNVMETSTMTYDITLHLTRLDLLSNILEFTITELRSKMIGDDNQLVEQVTTFMPGPKGEKGDQGEKGDTGSRGAKGDAGPAGADGAFPEGNASGDMQYWDGTAWVMIPLVPEGSFAPQLTQCNGVPRWMEYQIGDTGPAGGIVFHVTGCGGLEAAPEDQSTGVKWGCIGIELTGADGTAVGTGAQNTADILAGCNESPIAAEIADSYSLNGYKDWFLPSKDELHLMYINLHLNGLGGFVEGPQYWSSSEATNLSGWLQFFLFDTFVNPNFNGKNDLRYMRAVRAF